MFTVATDGAIGEHYGPVVAGFFADVVVGLSEGRHGLDTDAIAGL